MAWTSYNGASSENTDFEATLFALHSNLQLFPNDGIAASFQPDGIQYGSQIEQDDTRTRDAARTLRLTQQGPVRRDGLRTTFGLQFRDDDIESQLHRTRDASRLDGIDANIPGPVFDGAINETEIGAYAEEELRPTRWLRFVLGARVDRIDAAVNNESQTAVDKVSGVERAGQLSPKATAVVSPLPWLDLFANYGRGFHSNDARTIVEGAATTLIATATGYEVGTTVRPLPAALALRGRASSSTSRRSSPSTATPRRPRPSGPTRRYGGEFTGRWEPIHDIYADASFTVAHARYTDAADIAAHTDYVTLAPTRTFSAGVGARHKFGVVTLIGSAHVRSMADRPATQDGSLVATGFTVVDSPPACAGGTSRSSRTS